MSRIERIIRQLEAGKRVDFHREQGLQALDFARNGERYANEMIAILRSLDEDNRYREVESIELSDSGDVRAVHFRTAHEEPS